MDEIKVNGSFVSEKISKIRWIPGAGTQDDNIEEKFVTGSWDSISTNSIKLWKFVQNQYSDDKNEFIPSCDAKLPINGDVTGMEFINSKNFVVSTTEGFISIFDVKHDAEIGSLTERKRTECIHKLNNYDEKMPCTGLSVFEQTIASIGEDGRLNVLMANDMNLIRTIDNSDSCSLTAVSFINHKEILTGNRLGILKMFDIRSNDNPTAAFATTCEDERKSNYVSCITYHPTQKHIILVGSEEGSITVWDLRQTAFPASYLSAHTNAITELHFHRTQPVKLYTASENGELWQWNTENTITQLNDTTTMGMGSSIEYENINPWLNGERAKNKINVTALITDINKAINSFDAIGSKVICGCDSEAIYYISNLY